MPEVVPKKPEVRDVTEPISGPTLTILVYSKHGPECAGDRITMPDTSGGMACTAAELEQVRSMFAATWPFWGEMCGCCLDIIKCCMCQEEEEGEHAAVKRTEKNLQTTFPHLNIVRNPGLSTWPWGRAGRVEARVGLGL